MKVFAETENRANRARQAFQILIGNAMRKQMTTYKELSTQMHGHSAQGTMAGILACIAFWCIDNGLPTITVLVVNETTGKPGYRIPLLTPNIDQERVEVFGTNWYNILLPSPGELDTTFKKHV